MQRALSAVAITVGVLSAGCTSGQHRAYQYTMAGAALAGWGYAAYQTEQALSIPGGPYAETNRVLGARPGTWKLVGSGLFNVALVVAIRMIPERAFDDATPWAKDVLMTTAAVMGVSDGYGDYRITH